MKLKIQDILFVMLFSTFFCMKGSSQALNINDTLINILYSNNEKAYDSLKKFECQIVHINENYLKNLSLAEKAALGLLSTFIADDCNWDDGTRTNLNCRLTTLLGFGHQCSESHLGFLKHWFRNDTNTLKRIVYDSCSKTHPGANRQYVFTKITLEKKKTNIIVTYWATGISLRRSTSWGWRESLFFNIGKNETIYLTKRVGKKLWSD
ncbi:MAG: hypothetical protein JST94_09510 [Bacteroidetes bacterium]|nr:hypothetical protein [Bacteroidota bacterium]MBS1641481.1 hypothetical protein [Bacteroidota bacterium]MBS1671670.1 hypothetical protein [Bacteroidota bacterium]